MKFSYNLYIFKNSLLSNLYDSFTPYLRLKETKNKPADIYESYKNDMTMERITDTFSH